MTLEQSWGRLITGEARGPAAALARAGLNLLSGPYRLGLAANLALYDMGLKPRSRSVLPVVSVGNLSLGGAGKSTAVRYLAEELQARGLRPGIVLRGHRRTGGAEVLLASDGRGQIAPLSETGDEAAEVARALPDTPVAVGHRREHAVALLAQAGVQVAILDDGFQYFRMARDLDLVLVSARADLETARVFPRGRLREPWGHLARADQVWITHADHVSEARLQEVRAFIERHAPGKAIIVAQHAPVALTDLSGAPQPLDTLAGQAVLAVSGLGCPESFEHTLTSLGARVAPWRYEDHYRYQPGDWVEIARAADRAGAQTVITTAKDAVKLPADPPLPVWVLRSQMRLIAGAEAVAAALDEIAHRVEA
jgi:tetraacyldisaccharide 4'-kinase